MTTLEIIIRDAPKLVQAAIARGLVKPRMTLELVSPNRENYRRWTQANIDKGLTAVGTRRKRAPNMGQTKDRAAYMRERRAKREQAKGK